MITASHNPVEDNGVKLIEGNGEMMVQAWEVSPAPPSDSQRPAVHPDLLWRCQALGLVSSTATAKNVTQQCCWLRSGRF